MSKKILLMLWAAWSLPAHALTFVQMSDQALLDQSELVLEGEVVGALPLVRQPGDHAFYRVSVLEHLKGDSGSLVEVWVPGTIESGPGSMAGALVVPGVPRFSPGDQALFFLVPRGDGTYALTQSVLGVFYRTDSRSGQATASRRLSGTHELTGTGMGALLPAADQQRDWVEFKRWLKSTAAGAVTAPSYWNATAQEDDEPTTANFTTLGTPPSRWFEFDADQDVTQFAHATGQVGVTGGGYSEFRDGLAAWNDDAGSNIRYAYGGTTNANGGFQVSDGVNSILFNDPNNEIGGSFDCNQGGVLATGGFRTNGQGTFNALPFFQISESDIVVQDNSGCFLSGNNGTNAAEIFGHELGHTLGLGHSCDDTGVNICVPLTPQDDALMRWRPHADGRGAELRADDQAGAAFLYTTASSGSGQPPPDVRSGGGGGGGGAVVADSGGGGGGAVDPLLLLLLFIFVIPALRQLPVARLRR